MKLPAATGNGESLALGRPIYLVGYSGETEPFPQATISEGILSRIRQWEPEDWTFLQSDASAAGGQSGGALVDGDGRVVGITNFTFTDGYGLSGSLADAAPRIERMAAGEDHVFVLEAPLSSTLEVNASSGADLCVALSTIDGIEIATADYPGDVDWYRIELSAGETVIIEVDAVAFDPALLIDDPSADGDVEAYGGDTGGGAFGTNPMIVFSADEAGRYDVIVADHDETGPGAYRITID